MLPMSDVCLNMPAGLLVGVEGSSAGHVGAEYLPLLNRLILILGVDQVELNKKRRHCDLS